MTPDVPEEIRPGVVRVVAPNPGPMTGPGTNAYVVGDATEVVVVDPGPDDDAHLAAIMAAVAGRDVAAVAVTHHHADHWPLAKRVSAAAAGAPFTAHGHHALDAPDLVVSDGDEISVGTRTLRAVHTPGHASDHVCWLLDDGSLLTGDHVMSGSTVVIAPPDGEMAVYLESLQRTRDLAPARILPGHGTAIEDPMVVLDFYMSHRLAREVSVLDAVGAGAGTVDAVVTAVYTDVDPLLHPVARYSVLAHLIKLRDEGRVVASSTDDEPAPVPGGRGDAASAGPNPELPVSEPVGMTAKWEPA